MSERAGRWAVAAWATAIVLVGAWAPSFRDWWDTAAFRNGLRGLLVAGAAAALILSVLHLRGQVRARMLGLLALVPLVAAALVWGPTATEAAGRLREQTHLVQYGGLSVLYCLVLRRRFDDGSLYVTAVACALLVGLVDEAVQFWVPGRVGALADVRLDFVAGLLGALLAALVLLRGEVGLRPCGPGLRRIGQVGAVVVLALAGFIELVHLGHVVTVPDAAVTVHTRLRPASLADRARAWRPLAEPATLLGRLVHGQDFFAAEAGWHREERDRQIGRRELVRAYQQQRVLEACYTAYLAHLPPEQAMPPGLGDRGDLARAASEAPWSSGPPTIWTGVDRWVLWLAAVALAAAVALGGELLAGLRLGG